MSICGPMVLTPLIAYISPADFDWEIFKQIKSDVGTLEDLQKRSRGGDDAAARVVEQEVEEDGNKEHDEEVNARLLVARKKAAVCCVLLCLSFCILWPIPMYASDYGECLRPQRSRLPILRLDRTYHPCPLAALP